VRGDTLVDMLRTVALDVADGKKGTS